MKYDGKTFRNLLFPRCVLNNLRIPTLLSLLKFRISIFSLSLYGTHYIHPTFLRTKISEGIFYAFYIKSIKPPLRGHRFLFDNFFLNDAVLAHRNPFYFAHLTLWIILKVLWKKYIQGGPKLFLDTFRIAAHTRGISDYITSFNRDWKNCYLLLKLT